MVNKEELIYDSRDGVDKIHGIKWIPDGKPKCVLQIIHGMAEHIDCYDDFAKFMAEKGVLVVGEDHLGHGKSVPNGGLYGYMCEHDTATVLVRDVHRLKKMIQEENPGVPYFLLGHSMGSFILRNYLLRYGKGIDGAVIMATGTMSKLKVKFGKCMASLLSLIFGEKHRSKLFYFLAFGNFNARIKNPKSAGDWVCANPERIKVWTEDPMCSFMFTMNGMKALLNLTEKAIDEESLSAIPKNLPIYFMSGTEDPLGEYGKGVEKIYQSYLKKGFHNVRIKLYENCRHEILNELSNEKVYRDIYEWLSENKEA